MNIIIAQPKLEKGITQLEEVLLSHPSADLLIFPEGYLNDNLEAARELAKKHNKTIITGYKRPKDRAVIIDHNGQLLLDRAKYDHSPVVEVRGVRIGIILCDELVLQGISGLAGDKVDLIVHPIGVGMFSKEQFSEWVSEAKRIATSHQVLMIGTSHADGSFRNCEINLPIAYCIDESGEEVFISKNDVRTRILNMETRAVSMI